MIIYGLHPVLLFVKYRSGLIKKVYISHQTNISIDTKLIQKSKIVFLPQKDISLISKTQDHQGICAEIERFPYTDLDFKNCQTVCILDHIEDPRNLGAVIRNAAAFKIDGLIIPKERSCEITSSVIKASAGTAAFLPINKVNNINQIIKNLKDFGYWVYGMEASGENKLSNIKFDKKTVIVLGSEGRGISHLTKKLCDFIVSVEMLPEASSLNISSCAAIVFYQRFLQMQTLIKNA